jgi:hypothetical protein
MTRTLVVLMFMALVAGCGGGTPASGGSGPSLGASVPVTSSGPGASRSAATAAPAATPAFANVVVLSPTSIFGHRQIDTGRWQVGHRSWFSIELQNQGTLSSGPVDAQVKGPAFSVSGCSGPLNPGARCTLSLAFSPTSAGVVADVLTINASPGASLTVDLTGAGGNPDDFDQQAELFMCTELAPDLRKWLGLGYVTVFPGKCFNGSAVSLGFQVGGAPGRPIRDTVVICNWDCPDPDRCVPRGVAAASGDRCFGSYTITDLPLSGPPVLAHPLATRDLGFCDHDCHIPGGCYVRGILVGREGWRFCPTVTSVMTVPGQPPTHVTSPSVAGTPLRGR